MKDQMISDYLTELGKKEGTPGGGSATAYIGAMGASLASMVADIQKDKKAYAAYSDEIKALLNQAETLSEQFQGLAAKDAEAFEPVLDAYQLPKETNAEKGKRTEAIEEAVIGAANPPLTILGLSLEVIAILEDLTFMRMKGTIVNDLIVATKFMETVLETAVLNVTINTKLIKNETKKQELEAKANRLSSEGKEKTRYLTKVIRYFLIHNEWPASMLEEE